MTGGNRSTRESVLALLDHPRSPREIAESLGVRVKAVQSSLRRMKNARLVKVLTEAKQSKLYTLTPLGRILREELCGDDAPLEKPHGDLDLYAWVQAGAYRRAALVCLVHPMTTRELRKRVIRLHPRIGANHLHGVMRGFASRGIAVKDQSVWRLSPLGLRLQRNMLTRPPIVDAGWDQLSRR
ncbi:MAG: winged helix-turn-helix transcriptional regulator [Phycisphaerales bacterium]|nr:winged helix-turn-helix transcriptional regulator [Phycisphaerales bacterium]